MKDAKEALGNVGIILAGGGLRGYMQPVAMRVIIERGTRITYIGGVSVGALNGSALAMAQSQEELLPRLDEEDVIWNYIETHGREVVFPFSTGNVLRHIIHTRSWLPNKTLFALLKNFHPRKAFSSPITFDFKVLNNTTMLHETFSNRDLRLQEDPLLDGYDPRTLLAKKEHEIPFVVRGLAASASLKPIFSPIKIWNDYYSDGGSIEGLIGRAIAAGCDTIFVLFPYPQTYFEPQHQDDWIYRLLPWLKDFIVSYAAELRGRDQDELDKVRTHNLLVHKDARIAHLEETKGGPVGRWKSRLANFLRKVKQVRIVPAYGEPPPTFDLKSFAAGDFAIMRQRTIAEVNRRMDRLLK